MPSHPFLDRLFGLEGRVAIVTGGAGRLGTQYVRALAAAGASVAAFDIASSPSPAVQQLVAERGDVVSFHSLDVTRRDAVDAAVAAVTDRVGAPTILVNNA